MEEQQELIPAELLPDGFGSIEDPKGIFTGERVLKRTPAKYAQVVQAMAEGFSVRGTARAMGMHQATVAAIRDRAGESIDAVKKHTARTLSRFCQIAAERLLEESDDIAIDKLPIAMGIAAEKAELLGGRPTAIIGHQDSRRIGDVGSILDAIDVEVVEETESMGLEGGRVEQKGIEGQGEGLGSGEGEGGS